MSSKKVVIRPQLGGQSELGSASSTSSSSSISSSSSTSSGSAVSSGALTSSSVVVSSVDKLQEKQPQFNFKGFDYQPVEDDHSYQVGINWFWLNSHSGRSGERSPFDLSRGEGGTPAQKFAKYRQPNQVENGNRYTVNLTNVKVPQEKEIEFTLFPHFSPALKDVKTIQPESIPVTTRPVFVDSPVLLPPEVKVPEVNVASVENPEIVAVGFQERPRNVVGFSTEETFYAFTPPSGNGKLHVLVYVSEDEKYPNTDNFKVYSYKEDRQSQILRDKKTAIVSADLKTNGTGKRRDLDTILASPSASAGYVKKYVPHNGNLISQLDLIRGKYDLLFQGYKNTQDINKRDNGGFKFKITDGAFSNTDAKSVEGKAQTEFPKNYEGELYSESFYRSAGRAENIIGEEVVVNAVGKYHENATGLNTIWYVGNPTVKQTKREGRKLNDKGKYEGYISQNKGVEEWNLNPSVLRHKGTTNVYGNKIAITNIDDVYSRGNSVFQNEGKIIGHNQSGSFQFTEGDRIEQGSAAGHHVFGSISYTDGGEQIIHNTERGSVRLYAPNSFGMVYSEGGSGTTSHTPKTFRNEGELKLFGEGSVGVAFNSGQKTVVEKAESTRTAQIDLKTPLELLGDKTVGVNFTIQPTNAPRYLMLEQGRLGITKKDGMKGETTDRDETTKTQYATLSSGGTDALISKTNVRKNGYYDHENYLDNHEDGGYYYRYDETKTKITQGDPKNPDSGFVYKDLKGRVFEWKNVTIKGKAGEYLVYKTGGEIGLPTSKYNIKIGSTATDHQAYLEASPHNRPGNQTGGDENFIENAVALNFDYKTSIDGETGGQKNNDFAQNLKNYKLELGESAKHSVAVRVKNAKVELEETAGTENGITLNGENNIALFVDGEATGIDAGTLLENRSLKYINSENQLEDKGKNNSLLVAANGGQLQVSKPLALTEEKINGEGSIIALAQGKYETKSSLIQLEQGIAGGIASKSAVAFLAKDGGKIEISETQRTLPSLTNGHIREQDFPNDGFNLKGKSSIAFAAVNGGSIDAKNIYVKVTDGAAVAYSDGENSKINLSKGILDYQGNSYALFSKNNGKIDVSDAMIVLRDKAVGYDYSQKNHITITDDTKFVAMSNGVFAVSVKDLQTPLTLSNLSGDLNLPNFTMLAGEKDGKVFDKYREVFVDGASTFALDQDLIKTDAVDETKADTNTYKLLRKYLIQRAKVTLKSSKKIDAFLDSANLETLNRISLIGYDVSASLTATSNEDTQIILENDTTVNVDRTDADKAGGIGLFVNYGKISTDAGSIINVEKQTDNPANTKAVGIYAVNGSEIDAKGTVNVGGNNSVGLMGLSYRINEDLEAQKEEFLDKDGSGSVSVVNQGTLNLDGNESTGIYVENNKDPEDATALAAVTGENKGTINLTGEHSSGMIARSAMAINHAKISLSGEKSLGMIGEGIAQITNESGGEIVIDTPASDNEKNVSVGMVAVANSDDAEKVIDKAEITNKGSIKITQKGYGLYGGYKLTLANGGKITLGNESVGVFARQNQADENTERAVELGENSQISAGEGSIGVYVEGSGKATVNSNANISLGENSYNYLIKKNAAGTVLNSNTATTTIKTGSVHILSEDKTSVITNKTAINVVGDNAFGIHTAGKATNLANIDLGSGKSNVALYAFDGGEIVNGEMADNGIKPVINVSNTNKELENYSIGMAAGSSNDPSKTGTVINYGTINATKDYAVGMYASGRGSVAKNYGTINLSGKNAIGMFLVNGAEGENHGLITTTDTAGLKNLGIIGVLASSGATFKNYGRMVISGGTNKRVLLDGAATSKIEINHDSGNIVAENGAKDVVDKADSQTNLDKGDETSVKIELNGEKPKVEIQDIEVELTTIDTPVDMSLPSAVNNDKVLVDQVEKTISVFDPNKTKSGTFLAEMPEERSLGMYIDTSGLHFTNPIEGIANAEDLETIELVFGTEAAKYTDAKAIEIGQNILAPYNKMIAEVLTAAASEKKFTAISSGLTWIVTSKLNDKAGVLEKVYLVKVPYTDFANDVQSKKVLQGLENRYGTASLTPRERELYAKLNSLGKGEGGLFTQAVDELRGDQYANTTRRIKQSKVAYDYEFKQLMKWDSKTRETTKVKLFGGTTKYKTDMVGLKSYDQNMRGVFILNDDFMSEVKRNGTFYGLAEEQFSFKDLGGSKEKVISGQIGYFQEKLLDDEKQYHHLMKLGIEGSYRKTHRRYHIVDDIFSARAKYYSYGLFFDNQLSRKYEIDEKRAIEGKVGFDFGYMRSTKIHEKTGDMRLNLHSQKALTLRPKLAVEYSYSKPLDDEQGKLNFYAELEVAKDFGLQLEAARRAMLVNGNASEYDLARDKDRWSVKASGRITLEKEHFGVGLRAAYDFGQKQSLLGLELRVKF